MSVAWSWAFDSPFKWTKQIASHFGGTRQGMAMAWPGHIVAGGGLRSQFHHMIDIVPTILEAAGVAAPDTVDGIKQKPIEGVSMAYTWTSAGANLPSQRTTQYFEMFGGRAIYKDGWIASTTPANPPWLMGTGKDVPVLDYKWELYDLTKDFSQDNDLAAARPDKLKELQAAFDVEAKKYQVYPLDNSILPRIVAARPSSTAGRTEFTYTQPVTGIPMSSAPDLLFKDFTITAQVYLPDANATGMLTTIGGRFGGVGLYMQGGKPVFDYNLLRVANFRWAGAAGLAPGAHTIVFDFKYDGPGPAKGGTGTLSVDGKVVDTKAIPHTIPFLMNLGESLDVGSDTRTGVTDDYKLPFTFTGRIDKVVYKIGPPQLLSKAEIEAMEKARAQARQ
jgi:arylsulfatase